VGFLLRDRGDSVVWRGPRKTALVRQFLTDVLWGDLDYLLSDTPPGTSDEHISVTEQLRAMNPDGAVLVTTPQGVATADVRKELSFCRKVGLNVLGIIENMSGYVCPHCAECTNVFSTGGGEGMAEQFGVPFLGRVPIDPKFLLLLEENRTELPAETNGHTNGENGAGRTLLEKYQDCSLCPIFEVITEDILRKTRSVRELDT